VTEEVVAAARLRAQPRAVLVLQEVDAAAELAARTVVAEEQIYWFFCISPVCHRAATLSTVLSGLLPSVRSL
jgi:hypothetical protein